MPPHLHLAMLTIESTTLPGNLILAPLAGYSDLPFRLLCRKFGAALCVSEMISCHGLVYQQKKTLQMLQSCIDEKPVSFQLFGSDHQVMGEAAAIASSQKPDFIDINMGCPVKKVTKRGAGAALMADIRKAEKIIKAVCKSSDTPVTVKIRSGVDSSTINSPEFALMAQDNGVSAIAVHGRTWKQAFSGTADWQIIKKIKETVSIPVIGNGDVLNFAEAQSRLSETGCDGIMIGRAAIGNPWVFHPDSRPHLLSRIVETALEHYRLIEKYQEQPFKQLAPFKNHLGKYFKGFPGSSHIRKAIYEIKDWQMLKIYLTDLTSQ